MGSWEELRSSVQGSVALPTVLPLIDCSQVARQADGLSTLARVAATSETLLVEA